MILFILFGWLVKVQQESPPTFDRVDKFLAENYSVRENYFDSLLVLYPDNSYVIGMKVYILGTELTLVHDRETIRSQKARTSRNDPFFSYLNLAESLLLRMEGETDKAVSLLKETLVRAPENKWCLLELYYAQIETDPQGAIGTLSVLNTRFPKFGRGIAAAAIAIDPNEDPQGVLDLTESVPAGLWDCALKSSRGSAFYALGRYSESRREFNESLKLEENRSALMGIGYLTLYAYKNPVLAESYFIRALAIDPEDRYSILGLAWAKYMQRSYEKAEEYFSSAYYLGDCEECHEEYILFLFKQRNLLKARELVNAYATTYGVSFKSDGYKLMLQILEQGSDFDMKLTGQYVDRYPGAISWFGSIVIRINSL